MDAFTFIACQQTEFQMVISYDIRDDVTDERFREVTQECAKTL